MTTDYPLNWDILNKAVENATLEPEKAVQLNLYGILVPILGAVIIVLNLVVAVSSGLILRRGHQPRSCYLLLGNVAVADLVTGIAVIFGSAYPKQGRTEEICSLHIGMIVSSTLVSVLSVGLIAVDRFLYILHGLKYQHWVYPSRVRLAILFVWIIGLVVGFLPAMGWRGFTDGGRICWFILLAPPQLILITTALGVLPVLLVLVMYSIILHRALKKLIQLKESSDQTANRDWTAPVSSPTGGLRIFRGGSNAHSNPPLSNLSEDPEIPAKSAFRRFFTGSVKKPSPNVEPVSKMKAIRVVLLTTGSFTLTWLPYFIACSVYLHCDADQSKETSLCRNLRFAIASPLALLGFLNSLLNPLIYAWWHQGFRRALCKSCNQRKTHKPTNQRQNQQANQHSSVTRGSSIDSGTTMSNVSQSATDF